MICPRCFGSDVRVQIVEAGSMTKVNHASAGRKAGRAGAGLVTGGMSLLLPKRKETSKVTVMTKKMAICQQCGADWEAGNRDRDPLPTAPRSQSGMPIPSSDTSTATGTA
jgi:hypothetical protein